MDRAAFMQEAAVFNSTVVDFFILLLLLQILDNSLACHYVSLTSHSLCLQEPHYTVEDPSHEDPGPG